MAVFVVDPSRLWRLLPAGSVDTSACGVTWRLGTRLANSLALNGGTIRSSSGTDAELAQTGLGHDAKHTVDWQHSSLEARAPAVTGAAVVSDAGSDNTYGVGDTIRIRLASARG